MYDFLSWHRLHHPEMTAQDVVKLLFQSQCGCGHLLGDEAVVLRRIEAEAASLTPDPAEPLTEPLGAHMRLNLRAAAAKGIDPAWIARMMLLSQKQTPVKTDRTSVFESIVSLPEEATGVPQEALAAAAQKLLDDPDWLPSHSAEYHAASHPAYRVLSARFVPLLPVLCAIGRLKHQKERLLICIDGACGSGKSTLSRLLCEILDAPCALMDDFFTPFAFKTPERLAQPAGNADIERFCTEFLHPWLQHGEASYRPYLCHKDAFGEPVHIPASPVTVIEGSYSLHPDVARHADVKVFLTVEPDVQRRRILARDGEEMLGRFISTWIPLEQAYHAAFSLPGSDCLVIHSDTDV